jgi:cation diffusion facilitator CzcD-associated flavoprotein CzcO
MWMDYLRWYRQVLCLPVENNIELSKIEPIEKALKLHLQGSDGDFSVLTRKLVLATGRAAFGGRRIPEIFLDIPKSLYAHTEDDIDFAKLKGKNISVIGGAASAVDAAATALEAGAKEVHLFMRAQKIPRLNKFKSTVYPGFFRGFNALDKGLRWQLLKHGFDTKVAAPRGSMLRLKSFDNFHIHVGSPVTKVSAEKKGMKIDTPKGSFFGDFAVLGTGYAISIRDQPEMQAFSEKVLLWQDCYAPPKNLQDSELGRFPYLGNGFELQSRISDANDFLNRIHLFNAATTMTHAAVSSDIPGVNTGVERLINALAREFFVEAGREHLADFLSYDDPELLGDEWNKVVETPD